jgi:ribose 5-phosphate isomerase B
MMIYIGADHAGFPLKENLKQFLVEIGYEVEDMGAFELNKDDDYPDFIAPVARSVIKNTGSLGIILGGNGQGEAIVANRFKGARAIVYYGPVNRNQTDSSGNELNLLASTRSHDNANILSLGARYLDEEEAMEAVKLWLSGTFSGEERHKRRINKIDNL